MFTDSLSAVVMFHDSAFVAFDESAVDRFHCGYPLWQLGGDTVKQFCRVQREFAPVIVRENVLTLKRNDARLELE